MIKKLTSQYQYIKYLLAAFQKLIKYKDISSVTMSGSEELVEGVVCQVSDLEENELKTFKFNDVEILLVKQNNVIRALGSKCTHYGAPLVKGALGDGRIRCPWHGACFNLATGDIEDFPGIDSLPCYEVSLCDENVIVKAKKSDLFSTKRIKSMVGKSSSSKDSIVVVGGGPAAEICVETLRQENFDGDITMICKENYFPYDRVKCSKQLDLNMCDAQFRNARFYKNHDINVWKGVEATSVDIRSKQVTLSNDHIVPYNKLFIATGSEPNKLSVPGADLKNVFVLRHSDHAKAINSALSRDRNVVVVGSGFIGMELTDYCVDKVKKVSVVMRGSRPLSNVLGDQIGGALLDIFKKKSVDFHANVTVTKINGREKVESVELSNGTNLPADIVLLGTGARPSTAFLKESGINIELDGTIATNERLQTNIIDVYVGGDIAHAPVWSNDNKKASIGHFGLAHYHGRIAGLNLAGKNTELKSVPYFWTKLAGYSIRYCGYGDFEEIIESGSVDDMKFLFAYVKNDKVVAMSSCNMDPYVSKFAELTAQGKRLSKSDVCPCDGTFKWAK